MTISFGKLDNQQIVQQGSITVLDLIGLVFMMAYRVTKPEFQKGLAGGCELMTHELMAVPIDKWLTL